MDDESAVDLDPALDLTRPSIARVYDYLLGGSLNSEADRLVAGRITEAMPDLPAVLRANRAFAVRAVRFLVEAGIRQFLDLGSGLATAGSVHEVVREAGVDARVLYVDNDPVVTAHNSAIAPEHSCAVLTADVRDTTGVLGSLQATQLFDFGEPIAVLMVAVLHFVPDEDQPADVVARYRDALAPGSFLALTHAENAEQAPGTFRAAQVYSNDVARIHFRTRTEIAAFLDGWDPAAPGLVPAPDWRPEPGGSVHPAVRQHGLAAVARKNRP
ncbi:SAM-dependent methyltransferase [Streptacidiphilus fuscans]|uniref:SAM-dependent methyltransferase n=1 Tax=Streptacidiphilus fuscans TaxID=2789292 RepID=A0A931FE47_9ACTN|nr:SAM-dependent methyltransferase [Streptacidiphilus fuscans]MBF9067174.1 SAM-dependent methyltransferase [Streptacidiphilus fuscans]